jgi:quaternary ammonium compound-resistance protein SugE
MSWILLLLAGACEMIWPIGFKYTNGFKQNYPMVAVTMAIMILSFALLSQATSRGIHIGTAYAVWTGIGAAGTVVLGIILFHEPHDWIRLVCLGLIIVGVLGLKFLSPPDVKHAPAASAAPAAPAGKPDTRE